MIKSLTDRSNTIKTGAACRILIQERQITVIMGSFRPPLPCEGPTANIIRPRRILVSQPVLIGIVIDPYTFAISYISSSRLLSQFWSDAGGKSRLTWWSSLECATRGFHGLPKAHLSHPINSASWPCLPVRSLTAPLPRYFRLLPLLRP